MYSVTSNNRNITIHDMVAAEIWKVWSDLQEPQFVICEKMRYVNYLFI